MDVQEFRKYGKEMVDYICDYMTTLHQRPVIPDVQPGYLKTRLPDSAPEAAEKWEDIMKDVEDHIMTGITHWQHPRFHAYFPAGNSYPSILADMLSDALGIVGFSWAASPACAELEIVVLDWLAKMTGMPYHFQHDSGLGGGVLQGSASDSILVTMLAARKEKLNSMKTKNPEGFEEGKYLSKLVAYCSKLAHSCVEKAGMISCIKVKQLDFDDEDFALRGETLAEAIKEDKKSGLIPFFVCATLGTTACASCDNLEEISGVCREEDLWFHVDAAYAGSAFICPEFRHYLKGIEHVSSYNFNPNKWMLVNFDCSALWVKNVQKLTTSMIVDPVYLQHKHSSKAVDFRHWGIPLSRRFRSLKLWFVIRRYGVEGLRKYIRNHVRLTKLFESLIVTDERFQLIGKVHFGLACFRLKGPNTLTQCLIRLINDSGKLHMVPANIRGQYVIRFAVCSESAKDEDIFHAWNVIRNQADEICAMRKTIKCWLEQTRRTSDEKTSLSVAEESEVHDPNAKAALTLNGEMQVSSSSDEESIEMPQPAGSYESDEEECYAEYFDGPVKVDDSDLGVGVSLAQKQERRNSLFKMISDPYVNQHRRRMSDLNADVSIDKSFLMQLRMDAGMDMEAFEEASEEEDSQNNKKDKVRNTRKSSIA